LNSRFQANQQEQQALEDQLEDQLAAEAPQTPRELDMMDISPVDPILDRYSFVTGDHVVGVSVVVPIKTDEDSAAKKERVELQLIQDVYAMVINSII
jgi:hypothetical protein